MLPSIEQYGWWRGEIQDGTPKCLLTGLVNLYSGHLSSYSGEYHADRQALTDVVREQFPDRLGPVLSTYKPDVAQFNDHPDTTWADLELVVEKAAIKRQEAV